MNILQTAFVRIDASLEAATNTGNPKKVHGYIQNYGPITGVGDPADNSEAKYFLKEEIFNEASKLRNSKQTRTLDSINRQNTIFIDLESRCNSLLADDAEFKCYQEIIVSCKNLLLVASQQVNRF